VSLSASRFIPEMTWCLAGLPTAKIFFSARIALVRLRAATPSSFSSRRKAAPRDHYRFRAPASPLFLLTAQKSLTLETSQEFRTWKRYRGGWSLPIAIFDLKKNSYEELPKTAGMDLFPMWHGNIIYFISDRDGVMNLFSYDLGSKQTKKLTDYKEYDIKWPSLGPDAIVYENGGVLYEFNLVSGKSRNLPIVVRAEDVETRPEFKSVAQSIGSYSLSSFSGSRPGGVTRQYLYRSSRARKRSRFDHQSFWHPRTESRLVARWKVDRVSLRQDW